MRRTIILAVVATAAVTACGASQSRTIDPSVASARPVEPPLGKRDPIVAERCDPAIVKRASPQVACRWLPSPAPCTQCAVLRVAVADCGFRARNPEPMAMGRALATVHHRSEGDYLLVEDGRVMPLPAHLSLVMFEDGPVTFSHVLGGQTSVVSLRAGSSGGGTTATCESLSLRDGFIAPFAAAFDHSIRGWVSDRPAIGFAEGSWSVMSEEPEPSTFKVHAPHAAVSGLDAQIWTTFEHGRFRILGRRWGFPPVVIQEMKLQPVEISSAPPPSGSEPRVPAIVAHRGMSIGPAPDRTTQNRREATPGTFSVELPDRERGFRALNVDLGPQRDGCTYAIPKSESKSAPARDQTDVNENTKIVRTMDDDALWLVTRRRHAECTFKSDRDREEKQSIGRASDEPTRHRPEPERWEPVINLVREEIVLYAIREGSSPRASEELRVRLPSQPQSPSRDAGVTGLDVAASGTRLLVVVGGIGVWIDTMKVTR